MLVLRLGDEGGGFVSGCGSQGTCLPDLDAIFLVVLFLSSVLQPTRELGSALEMMC